jgi:hypothetical protein
MLGAPKEVFVVISSLVIEEVVVVSGFEVECVVV